MKKPAQPAVTLTNGQILAALRERYPAPEYAFMEQVRSRTGFHGDIRTADAIVMSLFPGRGLELHGMEIKVSRSDWIREKVQPQKAEEIQRHCDRWWLVVGAENIVHDGELPPTWGLLAPDPSPRARGQLRIVVQAPRLTTGPVTAPISRAFVAGIMRNIATAKAGMVSREEINDLVSKAREDGRAQGIATASGGHLLHTVTRERDDLKTTLAAFEAASGVEVRSWDAGRVGAAVRMVLACGLENAILNVERAHRWLADEARDIGKRLDKVRAELKATGRVPELTSGAAPPAAPVEPAPRPARKRQQLPTGPLLAVRSPELDTVRARFLAALQARPTMSNSRLDMSNGVDNDACEPALPAHPPAQKKPRSNAGNNDCNATPRRRRRRGWRAGAR